MVNSRRSFVIFFIAIGLFFLPLLDAWMIYPLGIENNHTSYSALGGILPWSDAQGYYSGANSLLINNFLDYWNIRRPLNAILFAVRLWMANNDFKLALIIQTFLCGFSCLLVTIKLNRSFGIASSSIAFIVLFIFATIFMPTTLSETLGLTIGCLGFVLLWEAITTKKQWLFFLAGLILTVGLNVRAGAFFILPFLVLWTGHNFRNNTISYQFNWPISFNFSLGIIIGFAFNLVLTNLYSDGASSGVNHGNFAHTLFGLVSGGKGWNYAYTIYPEIYKMAESELAKFLYTKSFEVFKNNPCLLLIGILKGWGGAVKAVISVFQSKLSDNVTLKLLIHGLVFSIVCFGILRLKKLYRTYKDEIGLISVALLSMFFSAGFIWTDGGFRVFAVTVPFIAAALGTVIGSYLTPTGLMQKHEKPIFLINYETSIAIILNSLLLVCGLISPILIKRSSFYSIPDFYCPADQEKIVVKRISGSPYIDMLGNVDKLRKSILKSQIENKLSFLNILDHKILTEHMALGIVYDLNSAQTKYVFGCRKIFTNKNILTGLCVTTIPEATGIMKIESYEALQK